MKNYLNIIFLFGDWDIDPRKHLYKEVLKQTESWSETLLVQQPVCLIGHLIWRFKQKIVGIILGKYKTKKLNATTVLFTPVILFNYSFWLKYKIIAKIDLFFLNMQLNKYVRKNYSDDCKLILWVFIPGLYFIIKTIRHDFAVYDLQDNNEYNPDNGELDNTVKYYNEKLIKGCDLVICTSNVIYEKSKIINKNSILVHNGNEFNNLNINKSTESFNELSGLNKPIIGYLGGIRHWLDFELIESLVKNIPNVYFVFIGILYRNAKNELNSLLKNNNVIWIKYMDQEKLPEYVRKFSVGLIPFKINKFTEGVFPNKFFEYMAMEVPIVTTALPDLKDYSKIIGYSNNHTEFIANCLSVIDGNYKYKVMSYKKIAEENSWESRAKVINEKLIELVSKT